MSQQNSKSARISFNGWGRLLVLIGLGVIVSFPVRLFLIRVRDVKQLGAYESVSSINQCQQAYFAEKSLFRNSVKALGIGIKTETKTYQYSLLTTKTATFNYGVSKQKDLRSFVGGVFVIPATKVESNASKNKITTTSILCIANSAGTIKPPQPTNQNGKIACATGTIELKN
ncbi:type IV pilin-like G/H family protein [Microcoleus sp. Pol7_A1]|uniref:type IV pilin-like G/H family protein n=1 Tax=Microcoleus sp. Pol7_A1 TaxID=2818893 RepID=UPI002FD63B72